MTMYRSLEELCRMERETGKPFWKIVQEDDCVEQGISAEESFAQMRGCTRQCSMQMHITMRR